MYQFRYSYVQDRIKNIVESMKLNMYKGPLGFLTFKEAISVVAETRVIYRLPPQSAKFLCLEAVNIPVHRVF